MREAGSERCGTAANIGHEHRGKAAFTPCGCVKRCDPNMVFTQAGRRQVFCLDVRASNLT